MHERLSLDEILKDPRGHFNTPESVLRDTTLSGSEKLKVLEIWREDEEALVRASSESPMIDGEQPMLRSVQLAIDRLQTGGSA